MRYVWKAMACVVLFTFANVVKSVAAKVLSRAFYASAHYKKAAGALENEYWMLALSAPREELQAARDAKLASRSQLSGMLGGLSRSRKAARKGAGDGSALDADTVGPLPEFGAAPAELHAAVTGMASAHPLLRTASARRRSTDLSAGGGAGAKGAGAAGGATTIDVGAAAAKDVELGGGAAAAPRRAGATLARVSNSLATALKPGAGRSHGGADGAAAKVPPPKTRAELRRMRETVAIKTFSTLVHR